MSNEITVAGSLIQIISQSRQNALKKVNEELINMYWKIGEHLSTESEKASFGDAYIDTVAEEIQNAFVKAWGKIHGYEDFTLYPKIMVSISGGADSDLMIDMIEKIRQSFQKDA